MKKSLIVDDSFRTNKLSLKPGGYDVTIIYANNKRLTYNKIKDPIAYINKIIKNSNILEILINSKSYWKQK